MLEDIDHVNVKYEPSTFFVGNHELQSSAGNEKSNPGRRLPTELR